MKGERAFRAIGLITIENRISFFKIPEVGFGLGLAVSVENKNKFQAILRAKVDVIGIKGQADLIIANTGIYFVIEGNVWDIFKANIDVSAEDLPENDSWQSLVFTLEGNFLADADGDGDFTDSYIAALRRFTKMIADDAEKRINKVKSYITNAQDALTSAQNWLEEKKAALRASNIIFDKAVNGLDKSKDKLEEAKKPFKNAIDVLEEAQRKVDRLCKLRNCRKICIPGIKCKICYKKAWFARIPYPCCHFNDCMISFPDPICVALNLACNALRGIAYLALEIAQGVLRLAMIALDAAKRAVSSAQFLVDKSRTLLDIAEDALSLAQVGLEGAKVVLEGEKVALKAVKQVVKYGVMALNNILQHGIQNIFDVRNCGFEIELSTKDLHIFDVHCNINAFASGFKTVRIRINFKDIQLSMWNAAKATIESILQSFGNIFSRRKRREIEGKTLASLYRVLRSAENSNINETDFEATANQTLDTVFLTSGFRNNTSDDNYYFRKQIFTEKCKTFDSLFSFLNDSANLLKELVNATANVVLNSTGLQDEIEDYNLDDIKKNITAENLNISLSVANEEFSITEPMLHDIIAQTKENMSTDPFLTNLTEFTADAKSILYNQTKDSNDIIIVTHWITVMNNNTNEYFDLDESCVDFLDCFHFSIAGLYEMFIASDIRNQTESLESISQLENNFLQLVGNSAVTIERVNHLIESIVMNLENIFELNAFCSKAPEVLAPLRNHTLEIGQNHSLACNVTGEPFPTIWWFKDDKPLHEETNTILEITNATMADMAMYHCIAGNLVANLTFERVYITVKETTERKTTESTNPYEVEDDTSGVWVAAIVGSLAGVSIIVLIVLLIIRHLR
ncbi:uncharacterized protein LOC128208430 [Mya arenaria]|uniref:uncharacterized protein LOC128208430 n=1 Tax=Mya arenaria TaxID=6604 RepID=UPI0022E0FF8A|nr:uncharacterized protein LOC128208430 [Mya arenaria]